MSDRTHNDGRPYYCAECGLGFGEFLACELPDCKLESEADALKRASKSIQRRIAAQRRSSPQEPR
jgi:hypothetical protein